MIFYALLIAEDLSRSEVGVREKERTGVLILPI